MTAKLAYTLELESLSTSAYQSVTSNAYFTFPDGMANWAAMLKTTSLTGAGNLKVRVDHAAEPDPFATWVSLMSFTSQAAGSLSETLFESQAQRARPLLPYGRVSARVEATGAGEATFTAIVAKIYGDK